MQGSHGWEKVGKTREAFSQPGKSLKNGILKGEVGKRLGISKTLLNHADKFDFEGSKASSKMISDIKIFLKSSRVILQIRVISWIKCLRILCV